MTSVRVSCKSEFVDQTLSGNASQLTRERLIKEWVHLFSCPPPKNTSSLLMQRVLAYERQCASSIALKQASKRVQRQFDDHFNGKRSAAKASYRSACNGTHLVREWNGRTYQVEVVERGILFDGKRYRSLSAVAKKITGTTWSGPAFFGLNGASRSVASREAS